MNTRCQLFEMCVEGRQIDEVVLSIFQTVLFHRSSGKFTYSGENTYSVGTVGHTDIDCDFIDVTYVRCSSDGLTASVQKAVTHFSERLRNTETPDCGQISLEFYTRRRARWPAVFHPEIIPWEVWTVRLDLLNINNEDERQSCRERVSEILSEKLLFVNETMNKAEYVPKMPSRDELDNVFETKIMDIQPFLHRFTLSEGDPRTTGHALTKFVKGTLAL